MAGKQKSSRGSVKSRVRKWVRRVRTESTYPPKGLFTKSALTIARSLASQRVSPKGPRSGMRMLTYFINRAGHGLNVRRRAELERAKTLLSKRIRKARTRKGTRLNSSHTVISYAVFCLKKKM